jgi:ADP-ribose pyrophosphatase
MRWDVLASEIVYRCRIFSLRRDRSRSRTGQTHEFHVLEIGDWVNVIPLTTDHRVIMVRQFRHGIRALTLEVPAGFVDEGEAPHTAALRELREETGYASTRLEALGSVYPNPALMNNCCHVFVAHDVAEVGAPQWDSAEEMLIEPIPLAGIPELVLSGAISNALTLAALQLLDLHRRRTPA